MTANRSTPRGGGRVVAEALVRHGARLAFCVPGESYLAVMDALFDVRDRLTLVACRHENGAANMAEAYGKLTGRVGVCLVTRGPGACNASIGVHTALQDSTPMVLLVGQVPRGHMGREAFQEVDYTKMFAPLAKWVAQAEAAADLPELMARAFHVAQDGRPGPAVLALPEDVLDEETAAADVDPIPVVRAEPNPDALRELAAHLARARRPLILVGGGGWTEEAKKGVEAFAAAADIPVCCSFRRHDVFDNGHRCFIGDLGIGPNPELLARVKAADVLLVIGARLGEITTQRYTLVDMAVPSHTLIHVHAGAEELGRVFPPTLAVHAGMAEFAAALGRLAPVDPARWRQWRSEARVEYEAAQTPPDFGGRLDLGAVMAEIDRKLPNDAVVATDAGNFSGWVHRFVRFGGGRRLLGATSGAMGYGVPAAVAAKITEPRRVVVGCVGDGGFGMTGQEIATAIAERVAPVIVVFNNGMYGTIRMHQERDYPGREIATALANPDFAALARAYGAKGVAVERTEDFAPAFADALAGDRAALIELRMDPDVITTRTTLTQIRKDAEGRRGNGPP